MKVPVFLKTLFYPGLDLHTRCRYKFLPQFFLKGPVETLDAGCGNGALSYAAYRLGNFVLGISKNEDEVRKNSAFFSIRRAESGRLRFEKMDLYDLPKYGRKFGQIICSETLEHIKRDDLIIKYFYDSLKPGGVLHLCSPFAGHPFHKNAGLNAVEDGGHVRSGYTLDSYKSLLDTAGFKIVHTAGLGSPLLVILDKALRRIRTGKLRDAAALPLFLLTTPLQMLDRLNPQAPFSLYVQAVK